MQEEDYVALATACERNQAQAMVELCTEARPVAGGWMTFGGESSFANKACGLGLTGAVPKASVEEVLDFFTSRGAEPRVEVCAFVHPSLLRALGERGFQLKEFENVLFRRLGEAEDFRAGLLRGWPAALEVSRVDSTDTKAVEEYVRVSGSGFFPEGLVTQGFLETALRAARLPHHDSFVARLEGEVVGASGCGSRAGLTALFGTSVLPNFQRRGVQQALIATRLERARALGNTLATIASHPGGATERNAGRLGFRMGFVRAILVRPGEGLAPSP